MNSAGDHSETDHAYANRSSIYAQEYRNPVADKALLQLSRDNGGTKSVLHLPCGVGDLSIKLANAGHRVLAADLEKAMLETANKLAKEQLPGPSQIRFVKLDMRSFALPETFDLIICAKEAFQFLLTPQEIIECLGCFRRHLAPNGQILLDFANLHHPCSWWDPSLDDQQRIQDRSFEDSHGQTVLRWRKQNSENWPTVCVDFEYQMSAHKEVQSWSARHRLRHHDTEELQSLLPRTGLKITDAFGDYQLNALTERSPRQILFLAAI